VKKPEESLGKKVQERRNRRNAGYKRHGGTLSERTNYWGKPREKKGLSKEVKKRRCREKTGGFSKNLELDGD